MFCLQVTHGNYIGQRFVLNQGETLIGRASTCKIQIDSASISRQHARVMVAGQCVTIENLSPNGVRIEGVRIKTPTDITPGQTLALDPENILVLENIDSPPGRDWHKNTADDGEPTTGRESGLTAADTPYPDELPTGDTAPPSHMPIARRSNDDTPSDMPTERRRYPRSSQPKASVPPAGEQDTTEIEANDIAKASTRPRQRSRTKRRFNQTSNQPDAQTHSGEHAALPRKQGPSILLVIVSAVGCVIFVVLTLMGALHLKEKREIEAYRSRAADLQRAQQFEGA